MSLRRPMYEAKAQKQNGERLQPLQSLAVLHEGHALCRMEG